MAQAQDWEVWRRRAAELLVERTGEGVPAWNARIRDEGPDNEKALKAWLGERGVDGYGRMLLVMERFGYPAFLTAGADDLIAAQYADRPALRPVYERLLETVLGFGDVTVQARKTYVSLLTPRRTFARVQPTTRTRVDVGLRLDGQAPQGKLVASRVYDGMAVGLSLSAPEDIDGEAEDWLRRAHKASL